MYSEITFEKEEINTLPRITEAQKKAFWEEYERQEKEKKERMNNLDS